MIRNCTIADRSATRLATILGAIVLVTSGSVIAQQLQPQQARISEAAIHADHQAYGDTQARIQALNERGIRVDDYNLSKAQCWLDTSFQEYTRNDRGGYPQAALDEAVRIISALEGGQNPGPETPLVNNAQKLRPDLWAKYDSLKQSPGFSCAAQATACAEVELVHAGNEIHDGGWRHAKPYIQIAEDLTSVAEQRAAQCQQPTAPAPVSSTERFDIAADALFRFDRGDADGLLPQGRAELDALAQRLDQAYAQVEQLRLVGHTDRLGSDSYNQSLSERRAATVKQYLVQRGVSAPIQASGVGESQPSGQTGHCQGERASSELTQCLQPDRRVSIEVVGVKRSAQ